MRKFSAESLRSMLKRYRFVVIKPLVGTGGLGVIKIERLPHGRYRYHDANTQRTVGSFSTLVRRLNRIRKRREYMVQQGIELVTIQGRPIDYRVKLVKKGKGWAITAVVGRLARAGKFVTNLCRGGDMLGGYAALRRSFSQRTARMKKATMQGVARTSTQLLEERYPGIGQLGFDFGVDRQGRIWIFEVNTRPH